MYFYVAEVGIQTRRDATTKIFEKILILCVIFPFMLGPICSQILPARYITWRETHLQVTRRETHLQVTCRWGALQVIYLAGNICWQSGQKLRRKIDHKSENFEKSVNSNQKWLEVYWARYQNTSMHTLNMLWLFSCAEKIRGKENTWWRKKW